MEDWRKKAHDSDLSKKVLEDKIHTLANEKSKLEGLLKTAKQMISSSSQNTEGAIGKSQYEESVNQYKTQIAEKDKEIQLLKEKMLESKSAAENEIRLLRSALYNHAIEAAKWKQMMATSSLNTTTTSVSSASVKPSSSQEKPSTTSSTTTAPATKSTSTAPNTATKPGKSYLTSLRNQKN
jgi:hypothetical protein